MASVRIGATVAETCTLLGQYILDCSKQEPDSDFHVAVSGGLGSMPQQLAQALLPLSSQINWSQWHIWYADERYVDLENPDSNHGQTSKAFLSSVPIPERNIHTIDPNLPLDECAEAYERSLRASLPSERPRLDLVLLGVGPDGHTASLFPGHPLVGEMAKWVAPIRDSPKPPPARVTLTLGFIAQAENVAFLATGEAKAERFDEIMQQVKDGAPELPSAKVTALSKKPVWFVDQAAAAVYKSHHLQNNL